MVNLVQCSVTCRAGHFIRVKMVPLAVISVAKGSLELWGDFQIIKANHFNKYTLQAANLSLSVSKSLILKAIIKHSDVLQSKGWDFFSMHFRNRERER